VRRSSAYSGFGFLPDGAWTATRYACPRPPDESFGKAETYSSTVGCVVFEKQVIALLCRGWYNWDKIKGSLGGNSYDDR